MYVAEKYHTLPTIYIIALFRILFFFRVIGPYAMWRSGDLQDALEPFIIYRTHENGLILPREARNQLRRETPVCLVQNISFL